MPDQAEVEAALAAFVAGAAYPEGIEGAPALVPCRVYRGWPAVAALEEDLAGGVAHVTVRPVADSVRVTTRYAADWAGAVPACPLMVESDADTVSFTGQAGPGVVAGVRVDGRAYAYRVTDAMPAGVVAAVLATMVRADRPALLTGDAVQFPGGVGVLGRAVADGFGGVELRRQSGLFRVGLWCPSPEVRDQLAALVDLAVAGVAFLDVGGWGCRVVAAGGSADDGASLARTWRRDLAYRVEWPTVAEGALPSMLFGAGTVNGVPFFG